MKYSCVGDIPSEWDLIPAKALFYRRQERNAPVKTEERLSLSIDKGITTYAEKTTNLDRFKENFEEYLLAYPEDLVLNSMNMIVGAIGVSPLFGCVSPAYYILSPKDNVSSRYYEYLFRTQPAKSLFHVMGKGIYAIDRGDGRVNTCRLKVSFDDLASLHLPYPRLEEQKRIVLFLDRKCEEIDNAISLQEHIIEELRSYKHSVICEVVTKGLESNVSLKDSGIDWIGVIPPNWNVSRMGNFFSFHSGDSLTTEEISDCQQNEFLYPVYGANGQRGYYSSYNLNGAHLLIGRVGALCGNVHLVQEPVWVTEHALIGEVKAPVSLPYYRYVIESMNLKQYSKASAQPVISTNTIIQKHFPVPPIGEQQVIAEFLDAKCSEIDALIALMQSKIEALNEYKKSIVYEYITGKKEVVE